MNNTYLDWLPYLENQFVSEPAKVKLAEDMLGWQDMVTNTRFAVKKTAAKELYTSSKSIIEALNDVELISEYLRCRDYLARYVWLKEVSETVNLRADNMKLRAAAMWPELPYKTVEGTSDEKIADVLLIRTGVYWALKAASGIDALETRRACLLSVFGLADKPAGDEWTAAEIIAGSTDAGLPEKLSDIAVVKGGAIKIKDYFLESNKPKEIRGASLLLDDINRTRYYQICRKTPGLIPESIIYAGGGNVVAVVPKAAATAFAREIEIVHREVCLTARAVAAVVLVAVGELLNYSLINDKLEAALRDKRAVIIPHWDNAKGDIDYMARPDAVKLVTIRPSASDNSGEQCQSCGIRFAQYSDNGYLLCASCERKRAVGASELKYFDGEYANFVVAQGRDTKLKGKINSHDFTSIVDDEGDIAVLYGDGNNFGALFGKVKSLASLRYLSRYSEGAAFQSVFRALNENEKLLLSGKRKNYINIIALGGDDIMMLVPAKCGMQIAAAIGQKFDSLFADKTGVNSGPTMSMGVVIADGHTPVRYLFEIAQDLLKDAKQKIRGKNLREGSMSAAVIKSFATFEDNINEYFTSTFRSKSKKDSNINYTTRPWTYSEFSEFTKFAIALDNQQQGLGKGQLYSIRRTLEQEGREYAEAWFLYQYARMSSKSREAIDKPWELWTKSGKHAQIFAEINGSKQCPWIDLIEFSDYIAGGEA